MTLETDRSSAASVTRDGRYHLVRRPSDVRAVFNNSVDFRAANALTAVTPLTAQSLRVLQQVDFALPPVLASNDGESHRGIRRVVSGFFTPATVSAIEPRIRELARAASVEAAASLRDSGRVDLVTTIAAHPPAIVMLDMLGLPIRDLPELKAWSRNSLELFWGWPDDDRQLELARSVAEFYEWLRELVDEAVAADTRNLFTALHSHGLSGAEIRSIGYFLLIAAQETTSQLTSTTLFRVLDGTVGLGWETVGTRAGASAAIRHVLAHESSGPTARRIVDLDTEFGGVVIPAGSEILLELTGNHDIDAETTDYSLAFGSGMHRCLGARLAELEATVLIEQTAIALTGIRLVDTKPTWLQLLSFRSPHSVIVERL